MNTSRIVKELNTYKSDFYLSDKIDQALTWAISQYLIQPNKNNKKLVISAYDQFLEVSKLNYKYTSN